MITIIHLSDLHIHGKASKPDNQNAVCLVDYLLAKYGHMAKRETFVVLTGDLVDDAALKQYRNLKRVVLDRLGARFTLLAAPGNHDYAWKGNIFTPKGPKRFKAYVDSRQYPIVSPVKLGDESKVIFVGVDTGDRADQVFFANGVLNAEQLAALTEVIDGAQGQFLIVYLHHHPFHHTHFTGFHGSEKFLELVRNKANLVLFGHKHRSEAFFDWYDVPLMLASGKTTAPNGGALTFRVVQLDPGAENFGAGLNGLQFYTEEMPASIPA
jgi:3',5'-cyclic AMP phosphodiesterase CpdA